MTDIEEARRNRCIELLRDPMCKPFWEKINQLEAACMRKLRKENDISQNPALDLVESIRKWAGAQNTPS